MTDKPKSAEPEYEDADGNTVTLDRLCRMEPAWAANQIRTRDAYVAQREAEVRREELQRAHDVFESWAKEEADWAYSDPDNRQRHLQRGGMLGDVTREMRSRLRELARTEDTDHE